MAALGFGQSGAKSQPSATHWPETTKSLTKSILEQLGMMGAKESYSMKEEIVYDGEVRAIILYAGHDEPGIQFVTPNEFSQQLASMSYSAGKVIPPHTHNPVRRDVLYTQEALFIRKGKIRVDFYSEHQEYQRSRVLGAGDVILLISGGHGFEVLEELNMVEVKQGPYAGDADKTRFAPVRPSNLIFD
jgi:hypothetical protein